MIEGSIDESIPTRDEVYEILSSISDNKKTISIEDQIISSLLTSKLYSERLIYSVLKSILIELDLLELSDNSNMSNE